MSRNEAARYSVVANPWLKCRALRIFSISSSGIGCAGLVVPGVHLEHLRFDRPVLHDLRRQFDEVAGDFGAGERLVRAVGEQPVQAVPELVEQRLDFLERQQGRLVAGRLREVAHVVDHRPNVLAVDLDLLPKLAHPGAAPLAGAREVVDIQDADVAAVRLLHFERRDVFVVDGDVGAFFELQPIQSGGHVKHALAERFPA